jgi:hypothetical protein
MEEIMKIPTMTELLRLTRSELLDLHAKISREIERLPAHSNELAQALEDLDNVSAALARRSLRPCWRGHKPIL